MQSPLQSSFKSLTFQVHVHVCLHRVFLYRRVEPIFISVTPIIEQTWHTDDILRHLDHSQLQTRAYTCKATHKYYSLLTLQPERSGGDKLAARVKKKKAAHRYSTPAGRSQTYQLESQL
jgi:hypothetical protein